MLKTEHYKSTRVFPHRTKLVSFVDNIIHFVGSLRFILIQSILIIFWIVYNQHIAPNILEITPLDPYPFIFLNSLLALQSAYLAPLILLGQNYKANEDTLRDNADFEADIKSEKMIEQILKDLNEIKSKI